MLLPKHNSNIGDYGFYDVDGVKFYIKILALQYASQHKKEVYWNFHDEYFSTFDCQSEPEESLSQLYAIRAKQLREKYDYLVLHFSGGDDSTNILETFVRENIPLDEIMIRGYELNDRDLSNGLQSSNEVAESKVTAIPVARYVKEHFMPHVKITIADTTDYHYDWFINNLKWYNTNPWVHDPTIIYRQDYDAFADHLIKIGESGKTIGHITGHDKPKISFDEEGTAWFYANDYSISRYVTARISSIDLPHCVEFFYTHKDSIKMQLKQAHTLARILREKNLTGFKPRLFVHNESIKEKLKHSFDQRYYEDMVGKVLYRRSLPKGLSTAKPISVFSTDDSPFLTDVNTTHFRNWARGITHVHHSLDKKFHRSGSYFLNGPVVLSSKKYLISRSDTI
jgi:hypothetical protein